MSRSALRLALVATACAAIIVLAAWLRPVSSATPATDASVQPELARLSSTEPSPAGPCWVAGDLVGDANPAEIATTLCTSS